MYACFTVCAFIKSVIRSFCHSFWIVIAIKSGGWKQFAFRGGSQYSQLSVVVVSAAAIRLSRMTKYIGHTGYAEYYNSCAVVL